jgi:hypothetical protein
MGLKENHKKIKSPARGDFLLDTIMIIKLTIIGPIRLIAQKALTSQ